MSTISRPAPFSAFTTPDFWNDPHISAQMLEQHLDPEAPLASRPHEFIDRSASWLTSALRLEEGSRLLDLGCGPGLYAERFARRGISVFGIDVSARSIAHARAVAARDSLPMSFSRGNYLEAELGTDYDAAILIYEDYCAMSPEQRGLLLSRVYNALRPGSCFVFDVTSAVSFASRVEKDREEVDLMGGFWSAQPYQGRHETWTYPELHLVLDRYTITTAESTRVFWNWMHCLSVAEVSEELRAAGFTVEEIFGDAAGSRHEEHGPVFAVLASVTTHSSRETPLVQ